MEVNKEELLKILIAVKPALSKKEILLQMSHIIFTGEDVATFNDTLCIIHPYKTDFKCSVQGEEFYKDSRNVGLWAKKRAKEMGVDLGPKFDEIQESARTGKILEKYDL